MTSRSQQELAIFAERVAGAAVPRQLGSALASGDAGTDTVIRRRWGTILGVNPDDTVNVRVDGVIIPRMQRVAWYRPLPGETVFVEYSGTDQICMGPIGLSANNVFAPIEHTHPPSRTPLLTADYTETNAGATSRTINLASDFLDYDQINLELATSGNMIEPDPLSSTDTVTLILGGPGSGGPAREPLDGQRMRLRLRTRSVGRVTTVRNQQDYDMYMMYGAGIDIPKDSSAIFDTAWDAEARRWHVVSFAGDMPVPVTRPKSIETWAKSEAGPTINLTTSSTTPAGSLLILVQSKNMCSTPYADIQMPSGSYNDWTQIYSDYSYRPSGSNGPYVTMKIFARMVTSTGQKNVTANMTNGYTGNGSTTGAGSAFLWVISDAAMPTAADVINNYTITQLQYHTLNNVTSPGYDRLTLVMSAMGDNGIADSGSAYGGLFGITPGTNNVYTVPQLSFSSIRQHQLKIASRYHDVPGPSDAFLGHYTPVATHSVTAGLHLRPSE